MNVPAGTHPRVRGGLHPTAAQRGDGMGAVADDHLVVFVGHIAAARFAGGPVEDLRVEDGGGEGVAGAQFQAGGRIALPHRPGHGLAFPEAEGGAVAVGGEGGAPGAELERADGDRRPALADPARGVIGVLHREIRRPGHRDLEVLGEGPDAGHRLPVGYRHAELLTEAGRAEPPAQDRGVELLGGLQIVCHQADPARSATYRGDGATGRPHICLLSLTTPPLCQRRGTAAPRAHPGAAAQLCRSSSGSML